MRFLTILCGVILAAAAGGLVLFAPDTLSIGILALMLLILALGYYYGVFRLSRFYAGFRSARNAVRNAVEENSGTVWNLLRETEGVFGVRSMDADFEEYIRRVEEQDRNGQAAPDIEDFYNADLIRLKTRQAVAAQIPGTLTGLGLLGTFVGLIMGIGGIDFATVEAAVSSIRTLIGGIQAAFYTSIAGVILSILFNLFHNYAWSLMECELGLFLREFHNGVLPSAEETERQTAHRDMLRVLEYLEQMPKRSAFSMAKPEGSPDPGSEQILMPQILSGLNNGEFTFYILPCYDLNNRRILSGEALVRWNHGKMGLVSPAVFLPILENNGAIVQLDKYVWEKVAQTIRNWLDQRKHIVPISVNISKTDMMSVDLTEFFGELVRKYRISPRYIMMDISMDAYYQAPDYAVSIQEKLQRLGFYTIMDGFDGNFVVMSDKLSVTADAVKLDLRQIVKDNANGITIPSVMAYAKSQKIAVIANGVQNMEQLSLLRKNGCFVGQGYYFTKDLPIPEFEALLEG